MAGRISRQSEHYGSEQALEQSLQAEANRRTADAFNFGHLLDGPGIGRLGEDPAPRG